ncbi:MAG: SLBB domain-containing protein [Myxococcales bacterium]|nr:SLBB domain-containing protein [Myxococcales bacterium]
MKLLTRAEAQVGPDLAAWRAVGGGEGLRRALAAPDAILTEIRDAGLRGMGGAGFSTYQKWAAVAAAEGAEKWVVCNGNEDEPGTFKDRFLLARTPHQVIEGALVAALAVGARHVVLYVNPRETEALEVLTAATAAWREDASFAALGAALGGELHLDVVESSGLYVGGEETAAIASVEGRFPFPRPKPPWPAASGVHGAPTLVNNVETLAHAVHVMARGAAFYRGLGRTAPGTKLYSLSGDVLRPGLHELPMGTTLRELITDHGGGMLAGRAFKAVFTGGPSNTLLTAEDLDVPLDFDSVRARGARLGTGAMIVISEGTSIVRKTAEYVTFFAESSCGQCPPCKVGTAQLARTLERIARGEGRPGDLASLESFARLLPGSGRCGLVDGAATVLQSSLERFRDEYAAASGSSATPRVSLPPIE